MNKSKINKFNKALSEYGEVFFLLVCTGILIMGLAWQEIQLHSTDMLFIIAVGTIFSFILVNPKRKEDQKIGLTEFWEKIRETILNAPKKVYSLPEKANAPDSVIVDEMNSRVIGLSTLIECEDSEEAIKKFCVELAILSGYLYNKAEKKKNER